MSTTPQTTSSGSGHETRDADVSFLLLTGLGLLLALVFVSVGIWIALQHFRSERSPQTASNARLATDAAHFPKPRLQSDPAVDLAEMRSRDARDLKSWGWIDRKAGVARVPVERAMQLLLEKGLPDVGQNQTPLSLMQARPGAGETPSVSPQPKS